MNVYQVVSEPIQYQEIIDLPQIFSVLAGFSAAILCLDRMLD
jgi:hypothetical protein